jgi:hypothetical protein|tara:strand:- start:809 stop:910 length:102 start_codon:yes stop_codon:yes gene_type:complete
MSDTKAEDLAFLIKTGQVKDTETKAPTTKKDEE